MQCEKTISSTSHPVFSQTKPTTIIRATIVLLRLRCCVQGIALPPCPRSTPTHLPKTHIDVCKTQIFPLHICKQRLRPAAANERKIECSVSQLQRSPRTASGGTFIKVPKYVRDFHTYPFVLYMLYTFRSLF